ASNYSTTYSKSVAFKRQQAARLQVKSNHSVKFCGVELAHARSAASNYSTTYSKSVAFKRQQAARLQVKSNHSVKFCGVEL
ncbi:hypothetical protein H4J63_20015, partial [Pseudoalteromonas sp. 5Ae-yellow]|uniref:hypothetical protein n=1 Tax=Pseudoalteromonas sp. 5Ae-yellow TaxID=2759847 RepID=UPI0015F43368